VALADAGLQESTSRIVAPVLLSRYCVGYSEYHVDRTRAQSLVLLEGDETVLPRLRASEFTSRGEAGRTVKRFAGMQKK